MRVGVSKRLVNPSTAKSGRKVLEDNGHVSEAEGEEGKVSYYSIEALRSASAALRSKDSQPTLYEMLRRNNGYVAIPTMDKTTKKKDVSGAVNHKFCRLRVPCRPSRMLGRNSSN
jgi:hypothetical protein